MKILAGVMGAEAHIINGQHQMSRQTWMQDFKSIGDCRFFVGDGSLPLQDDEIRVDVPDDKAHILYKTVEILKWSLENNYDMTLKLDTDTYVNTNLISKQDYTGLDYIGSPVGTLGEHYAETEAYSFIQGSATWISPKAAEIIINEAIPAMHRLMPQFFKFNGLICPYPHAEDLWIGQALTPHIKSGRINTLADYGYSKGPLTYHFALTKKEDGFRNWMSRLHENRLDINTMDMVHKDRRE